MNDTNRPLPYAVDVETIPVDEAEDIQRVIQALELILARSQTKSGQFRADVHVKTHGCAQGEVLGVEGDTLLTDEQRGPAQDFVMNLSFNVWHALAVHRPLGGINRVRRRAYALSCAWRRQQANRRSGRRARTRT